MPSRLKSLELFGYKTFASRTNFEFPSMITAIVGPNGSGKSNITDGLRWVLGEQAYSLLRGKKTEDMIFTGSEQRPRAGMAACTIVFDNTNNWLPIDYSEVAITRRAYRDGQNEYLLNGQKVRLKDISELLAQSGLSERNYSIIGQGLIDNSLALRPEERRKFFEEAAGIGLYRGRRIESLNRLEVTHRNMERVRDILAELEPRIRVLEKQAKKAEEYERIKADLRLVLREWYGYHWHKGQADIARARENQKVQEVYLEQVKSKHLAINEQIHATRLSIQSLRQALSEWHAQSSALIGEKDTISKELAVSEERYRSLTNQVHSYEVDITRLQEEIDSGKLSLEEILSEASSIQNDLDTSREKEETIKSQISAIQSQKDIAENSLNEIRTKVTARETAIITTRAQIEEKNSRSKSLEKSLSSLAQAAAGLKDKLSQIDTQFSAVKDKKEACITKLGRVKADLALRWTRHEDLENEIILLNKEKLSLEQDATRIQIEIGMLEQAEKNLVGFPSGAKSLLESIRRGDITGFASALSSQMIVAEEYERAISAALGEFTDAVVVRQNSDADKSLSFLESSQHGRTALLAEGWIKPRPKYDKTSSPACIGNALDLIKYPKEYAPFYELLLSHVLLIKDRKFAGDILHTIPDDVILVTLKGEIFYPNGRIIGGKPNPSAHISRPRQMKELLTKLDRITPLLHDAINQLEEKQKLRDISQVTIKEIADEKTALEIELKRLEEEFNNSSLETEKAIHQYEWTLAQQGSIQMENSSVAEELSQLSALVSHNQVEIESLTSEFSQLALESEKLNIEDEKRDLVFMQTNNAINLRVLNELNKRIAEKRSLIQASQATQTTIRNRIIETKNLLDKLEISRKERASLETEVGSKLEEIKINIEPAETKLMELESKYNDLTGLEDTNQNLLNSAEKYHTQAQMELIRKKESVELLRRRIEEDFGLVSFEYGEDMIGPNPLPIEGMVEQLPVVSEIPEEVEENITRQKSLLRRLGAVNPEAKEEYETTRERYDFLTKQITDLTVADENLKHILADLDLLMKSEFKNTFTAVAEEFPKMFNRLFGGGSARLVMSDPDDLNESGIEIHARLPGKREQELTLLSGGERSLTAVALIFALLKVSPTPFCVLDEVDAMLDESNVGRFRDLLLELSRDIQFILVTHNRNTVQVANIIYGVTMGRDSSSQIVSLRLDEVPAEML